MRTRFLLALAGAMLLQMPLSAQVKIGNNPQTIHPSSLLELESSDRVLVISRVSTAQMEAIVPERGALVYNTDEQCLFYYDGLQWQNVCASLPYQFTTDPIVNTAETIVITENGEVFNFEVGEIRSENIADFSISGVDIQNNAIGADKLAPDAVGTEELQDNSIADAEINFAEVTLSDFTNDAGYLTTADLVSADDDNVLFNGSDGGVYYNDQFLIDAIDLNTTLLNAKENLSNKSDDALLGDTNPSTTLYPTQNAVKTYVDNAIGGATITGDANGVFFADATGTPVNDAPKLFWDPLLRFNSGGLGIGLESTTHADLGKVQINENVFGPTMAYPIHLQNSAGTISSNVGLLFGISSNSSVAKGGLIYERTLSNGRGSFHILQNAAANNTTRPTLADAVFTVTNTGQVGIGTTAPAGANLLQVAGRTQTQSLSVTGALLDSGGNAGAAGQLLSSTGGGTQWIAAPSGADGVITNITPVANGFNVTGAGGAFNGTVDLDPNFVTETELAAFSVDDADANPTNELIQTFQINGTNLELTENGNLFSVSTTGFGTDNQVAAEVGILYGPTNYTTPDINGNTAVDVEDHLAGIDAALAGGGGADDQTAAEVPYDPTASGLSGTNLQDAIDEIAAGGSSDDQIAAEVPFTPYLTITATQTQGAIEALKDELDAVSLAGGGNPTDELNTGIAFDGANLTITDAGGDQTIDISSVDNQTAAEVTVAATPANYAAATTDVEAHLAGIDAALTTLGGNPTDELNTGITFDGTDLTITDAGGNQTIDISSVDNQTAAEVSYDGTTSGLLATDTQAAIDELAAASFVGEPTGIFFANAATGAPTTNAPSLQWDQSKRFGTGALGIGIDGGTLGDFSKLHISEQRFGTIAYPIEIQNRVGINNSGTSVGVLFAVEASGTFGKGGLIYERRDTWGRGAFHFLQNTTTNTSIPTLADAVFTVTNAGQVGIGTTTPAGANLLQVAGRTQTLSLFVTGTFLDSSGNTGAAGEVLSSTVTGTQWIANTSTDDQRISGSVLVGETLTIGIEGGTSEDVDLSSFALDTDVTAAIAASDALDGDTSNTNEIELPAGGNNGDILSTDGAGTYSWVANGGTDTHFGDTDLTITANRTHNLNGNDVVFSGSGSIGIGNAANPPASRLDVDGQIQARNGFAASDGSAGQPSYGFYTGNDTDMGMFRAGVDQLAFSTNSSEAVRINGTGQVGIGETNPTSTLDINGSFAASARSVAGSTTLQGSDHTLIITGPGVITLPAAGDVEGRIYVIKDVSGGGVTTSSNYNDSSGSSTNIISGVVWLQSIAGNWEQIN